MVYSSLKGSSLLGSVALLVAGIGLLLITKSMGQTGLELINSNPDDIQFKLYPFVTNSTKYEELIFENVSSLTKSGFGKNSSKTIFLIHGFRMDGDSEVVQVMKDAYLNSDLGYNYIIVDWGALSSVSNPNIVASNYALVSVKNVPLVAQRLANFINWLVKLDYLTLEKVHIVGHSLGGQIAGLGGFFVNNTMGARVDRITGLDPAGLLFYVASRRLQKTDADFVDVIHTNAGLLGTLTVNGHADFYPNGGSFQPGCVLEDLTGSLLGICSHEYSFKLYAASFKRNFTACSCPRPISEYSLGFAEVRECMREDCPNRILIGLHTPNTARGQFFLKTEGISCNK